LLGAVCLEGAGAASKLALVPRNVGDHANYTLTATTTTPGGDDEQHDWNLTLVRESKGNFDLAVGSAGESPDRYTGWLQKDGTIGVRDAAEDEAVSLVVQRYNVVAGLLGGAPATLTPGASWKAKLDVVLPHGTVARVPAVVKVLSSNGADVALEADGQTDFTPMPPGGGGMRGGGMRGGGMGGGGMGGGGMGGGGDPGPGGRGGPPHVSLVLNAEAHFTNGTFASAEVKLSRTGGNEYGAPDETVTSTWLLKTSPV